MLQVPAISIKNMLYLFLFQDLENTRNKLADAEKLISSQDKLVKDLEEKIHENTLSQSDQNSTNSEQKSAILTSDKKISDPLIEEDLARLSHECKSLQEMVQKLEEANANLQVCLPFNFSFLKSICVLAGGLLEERGFA